MSSLPKHIERIVKSMYHIPSTANMDDYNIPIKVIEALEYTNELCQRAGGELVSRQIIADIVFNNDINRAYTLDIYELDKSLQG
jgi:hypothetical protein